MLAGLGLTMDAFRKLDETPRGRCRNIQEFATQNPYASALVSG